MIPASRIGCNGNDEMGKTISENWYRYMVPVIEDLLRFFARTGNVQPLRLLENTVDRFLVDIEAVSNDLLGEIKTGES